MILCLFNFRANLSHDYFTNRQDRYILFNKCKSLTDFFDCLVNTVSDLSLKLHCDNSISVKSLAYHPFKGDYKSVFY